MAEVVRYETDGDVAVITVNNPPVNALSHAVRAGIKEGVERAAADESVKAVALVCDGRTFIAGAGHHRVRQAAKGARGCAEVNVAQEDCPKPIVAGIHGTALGGGLETALACHHRIAVPSARVGLPEVKLGILPGAGGTQRLPRLVGVEKAIEMICGGDPIGAEEAARLGVVDKVVEGGPARRDDPPCPRAGRGQCRARQGCATATTRCAARAQRSSTRRARSGRARSAASWRRRTASARSRRRPSCHSTRA